MKKTAVYIFVDALGWEIVSKYRFMENEFPYRQKVKMQFGYSSTAIPTILSGESPEKHGHFSFYYYDSKNSPFKIFKYMKFLFGAGLHPKCIFNRGRVRHKISKIFQKLKGYTGYFQLYGVPFEKLPYFDYCEKNDIFAKGGLAPVKNLRDILEESGLEYHISDWRKSETENIGAAKAAIESGNLDFAFVYTADFDGFLHDNVDNPHAISEKLKTYEAKIGGILDALKKSGREYKLTIISDHGMTAKTGTVDLIAKIGELKLKFGRDYVAIFDSTMLRVWYLNPAAKEAVRKRLSQKDCRGALLAEEEKKKYGIDFKNRKFGQDIFLTESGIQIEPSDMGLKSPKGMHGFSPEDKDSYAAMLSTENPPFNPYEVKDFFKLMKADIEAKKNV